METMPAGTNRLASKMYAAREGKRRRCLKCGAKLRLDLHVSGATVCEVCERKMKDSSARRVPEAAEEYSGPRDQFAGRSADASRVNRFTRVPVTESERSERERRKEALRRELKASGISGRELAGLLGMDHTELKGRVWGGGVISEAMFTRWTRVIEREKARAPGRGRVDGQEIKQMRKAVGLSARLLAERLGVGQGTLTGWERGKTRPTRADYELAVRICRNEAERLQEGRRP